MAMAYVKGPTTFIDSSASLLPCNLSILTGGSSGEENAAGESAALFGVIHKQFVTVGHFGSQCSAQQLVSCGKLEDKSPSAYLTQVSGCHTAKISANRSFFQARWCKMDNSLVVLVLTSYKGLKVCVF